MCLRIRIVLHLSFGYISILDMCMLCCNCVSRTCNSIVCVPIFDNIYIYMYDVGLIFHSLYYMSLYCTSLYPIVLYSSWYVFVL